MSKENTVYFKGRREKAMYDDGPYWQRYDDLKGEK
jgi:hypothetical protein